MNEIGCSPEGKKASTSCLAAASLVLSIAGGCINGLISITSLALGIIALIRIKKSPGLVRAKNLAIAGIVISTITLLFVSWNLIPAVKTRKTLRRTQRVLAAGRLSNLPASTTGLKAGGWAGLFTGEDYVKFHATSEDIEKFITESPSIKKVTPEIFSPEHMYLPRSHDASQRMDTDSEDYFKHKYYYDSDYPSWYDPTIKLKGRLYEIPGDPKNKGHNQGSVIINDETNTVYIWVMWS